MRVFKFLTLALALFGLTTLSASAGDNDKAVDKRPAELHHQTHCPVMGGKIDSSAYTDIQGQRVYHCCPMCSAKLKKDPDKYFQKAAEEGVLFENIQTYCPVSGEDLDEKSVSTDYEGRHLRFCCNDCVAKFQKDPQKYLQRMDRDQKMLEEKAEEKAEQKSEKIEHMDHDHH